jgi:hypothetical protein
MERDEPIAPSKLPMQACASSRQAKLSPPMQNAKAVGPSSVAATRHRTCLLSYEACSEVPRGLPTDSEEDRDASLEKLVRFRSVS